VLFGAVCFSDVWRCLIFLPQPTGKLAIGCITIFISREDAPASERNIPKIRGAPEATDDRPHAGPGSFRFPRSNDRFGSNFSLGPSADMPTWNRDVRFTPTAGSAKRGAIRSLPKSALERLLVGNPDIECTDPCDPSAAGPALRLATQPLHRSAR
jgi:hypothetical protein